MRRIILLLLIIISISCSPLKVYRELPEVKAWEPEIRKFEQRDKREFIPGNPVLFTGSSSIRLWSSLEEDMSPYPVIQRGYGGAKLSDFAVYAERIIYPHNPRAIVIFVANDISGSPVDKKPEEVLRLFNYLVKTIRKELPETPVFWIAITPNESRWEVWPQIREANNLIDHYCKKNLNLHYISTEDRFLNVQGTPKNDLFLDDLLHLNAKGYSVWTEIIKNELERVLNE